MEKSLEYLTVYATLTISDGGKFTKIMVLCKDNEGDTFVQNNKCYGK